MLRFIIFFWVPVAVASGIAVWFADRPGKIRVEWMGNEYFTTVGEGALLILLLVAALLIVFFILRAFLGAPSALLAFNRSRRRQRGYEALTQGLVAVAAGDADEAKRLARRADGLLSDPPLTMLLSAQAAQLGGDDEAAKTYFTAMLKQPEMEFLGLRGLLTHAVRTGDKNEALALAQRAYRLRPKTPWVLETLLDLQIELHRWRDAEITLKQAAKAGVKTEKQARRLRTELLWHGSLDAERKALPSDALDLAKAAHNNDPDFVPATLRYARLLLESKNVKRAARVIEQAWARAPHPDLADVYRAAFPDDTPLNRFKRFQKLYNMRPNDPESDIALASAALDAEIWGEARQHLEKAVKALPIARVYRLYARLEQSEKKDDEKAQAWLLKAAAAGPEDPRDSETLLIPFGEEVKQPDEAEPGDNAKDVTAAGSRKDAS